MDQNKFKVGDRVRHKEDGRKGTVINKLGTLYTYVLWDKFKHLGSGGADCVVPSKIEAV